MSETKKRPPPALRYALTQADADRLETALGQEWRTRSAAHLARLVETLADGGSWMPLPGDLFRDVTSHEADAIVGEAKRAAEDSCDRCKPIVERASPELLGPTVLCETCLSTMAPAAEGMPCDLCGQEHNE